jgi:hypothetical protein
MRERARAMTGWRQGAALWENERLIFYYPGQK